MNGVVVIVRNSEKTIRAVYRAPKGISMQQAEADVQYAYGRSDSDDVLTELGYEPLMYLTIQTEN